MGTRVGASHHHQTSASCLLQTNNLEANSYVPSYLRSLDRLTSLPRLYLLILLQNLTQDQVHISKLPIIQQLLRNHYRVYQVSPSNQSHQPTSKMSSQKVTSTYPSTTTRPSFETSKSLSTSTSSTSSTSSLVNESGQMKSENLAKKAWKAVVKHAKDHHRSVNAAYAVYYGQGQGQSSGVRRE